VLQEAPPRIDFTLLERVEEFRKFRSEADKPKPAGGGTTTVDKVQGSETPEETLERAYQNIRAVLASELLERVKASSPSFFERLGGRRDYPR
jgi:restriction system protein